MKTKAIRTAVLALSGIMMLTSPLILDKATATPLPTVSSEEAGGYILREYNGEIGIFSSDSSVPLRIIEVKVSSLPDGDRSALSDGVYAANEDELNKRIEDYSS